MFRLKTASLLLLPVLSGCLEVDIEVKVSADGSGTQTLKLGASQQVIAQLNKQAQVALGQNAKHDPLAIFRQAKVTKEFGDQGLVMASYKTYRERRRRWVEWDLEFPSMGKLNRSGVFGGKSEWYSLPGRHRGGIRLVCYPQGFAAYQAATHKAGEIRKTPMGPVQKHYFRSQKSKVAGLNVKIGFELPGEIRWCSSNLRKTDDKRVEAVIRADDILSPEDLVLALAPRYEIEFDGRGCSINIDGRDPLMSSRIGH